MTVYFQTNHDKAIFGWVNRWTAWPVPTEPFGNTAWMMRSLGTVGSLMLDPLDKYFSVSMDINKPTRNLIFAVYLRLAIKCPKYIQILCSSRLLFAPNMQLTQATLVMTGSVLFQDFRWTMWTNVETNEVQYIHAAKEKQQKNKQIVDMLPGVYLFYWNVLATSSYQMAFVLRTSSWHFYDVEEVQPLLCWTWPPNCALWSSLPDVNSPGLLPGECGGDFRLSD